MAEELRALPSEESARAQDVVAFLHRVRSDSTRPPPSGSDSADEVRIPKPPRLPGSLPASEERAANPVLDKPQAAELDMPTVPKKSATKKAKHSSTSKPKSSKLAKVGLSARRAAAANMTVKAEVDAPASTRPASRRRALVAAAAVAALIVAVGLLRLLGGF